MTSEKSRDPSSFKDPDGHVFYSGSEVFREVYESYNDNYRKLMDSGLYDELTQKELLIEHEELKSGESGRALKMDKLDFVSYPYEWCFSQLKDAALLTLEVERIAGEYDMTLKDASAYNVQFKNGKPIFIDTLSFKRQQDRPWSAYRQFCRHFIAPLALIKYTDIRLNQLMKTQINGVPLDLASKLLPRKTYFSFGLLIHIHLHSKFQSAFSDQQGENTKITMSSKMLSSIKRSLKSTVNKLGQLNTGEQNRSDFDEESFTDREKIVKKYLRKTNTSETWILNIDSGSFTQLISKNTDGLIVSLNKDFVAAEQLYKEGNENVLPLVQDLANPSPELGWNNKERKSLFDRGSPETAVALDLTHYLAIPENVPFSEQAKFFSENFENLIIEFIPKEEPKVQELLSSKQIPFKHYRLDVFEEEFKKFFTIVEKENAEHSDRKIYLMKKKEQ